MCLVVAVAAVLVHFLLLVDSRGAGPDPAAAVVVLGATIEGRATGIVKLRPSPNRIPSRRYLPWGQEETMTDSRVQEAAPRSPVMILMTPQEHQQEVPWDLPLGHSGPRGISVGDENTGGDEASTSGSYHPALGGKWRPISLLPPLVQLRGST